MDKEAENLVVSQSAQHVLDEHKVQREELTPNMWDEDADD